MEPYAPDMIDLDLWQRIRNLQGQSGQSHAAVAEGLLSELAWRRRQEREAELPIPYCCPAVAGARVIRAVLDETRDHPIWMAHHHIESSTFGLQQVSNCPFCGTRLPGFRLKESPPAHVASDDRDDPRCRMCESRWDACFCSYHESAWEADDAPPVGAAVGFVRRVSYVERKEECLSVSRKTNPDDKGLPGGKLDPGETPGQALVRELDEEVDLLVQEFHLVLDIRDDAGTRSQFFYVTRYEREPRAKEKGIVEWLPPEDLVARSSFGQSNRALMKRIDPHGSFYRGP